MAGSDRGMTGKPFVSYDFDRRLKSTNIELIFGDWRREEERVLILSPHDDDALLGAGYLLSATISEGCTPYVLIYCDGRAGYSNTEEKERIVSIRRAESANAYRKIGIKAENILRFDYPDLSLRSYTGLMLPEGIEGTTAKTIKMLRKIKPTRVLIPNEYRENADHEALAYIGTYDGPLVGDPVVVDLGQPFTTEAFLKYSVWGDFSPQEALLSGRCPAIRGNVALEVEPEVEQKVIRALKEFRSQEKIIDQLVRVRSERALNGGYIEVYLKFNPRPSISYCEYKRAISEINRK